MASVVLGKAKALPREKAIHWLSQFTAEEIRSDSRLQQFSNFCEGKTAKQDVEFSARETKIGVVEDAFGLQWGLRKRATSDELHAQHIWNLKSERLFKQDYHWLQYGLHLHGQLFDNDTETSARARIDLILLTAMSKLVNTVVSFDNFLMLEYQLRLEPLTSKSTTKTDDDSKEIQESPFLSPLPGAPISGYTPETPPEFSPIGSASPSPLSRKSSVAEQIQDRRRAPIPMAEAFASKLPQTSSPNFEERNTAQLKLFTEVAVKSPIGNTTYSGRCDYAIGYGTRKELDTFFVVVEAKALESLSIEQAFTQTCFYLGTIHQARKRAEPAKRNATVFGIITNGQTWVFIRVGNDGIISKSPVYDWDIDGKTAIMSYLIEIVDVCRKQSPSSTPTHDYLRREAETKNFVREVESKAFELSWVDYDEDTDTVMDN